MTVLILTPLSLEYAAVIRHLTGEPKTIYKDQANYEQWEFAGKYHSYTVIVREPGIRNMDMALATDRAINSFQPNIVLLIGIAGGIKDVQIGDVVVASSVFSYDSGKESDGRYLARPTEYAFSSELLARAQTAIRKGDWKRRITKDTLDSNVLISPIAAGDKLVAGTDNPTYQRILQNLSQVKALEMEAGGFGLAIQVHRGLHALVIRGISDLCAKKEETDRQNWQPVAAQRAAAFAFELLWQLDASPFISKLGQPANNMLQNKDIHLNLEKSLEDLIRERAAQEESKQPKPKEKKNSNRHTYNFGPNNIVQINQDHATGEQIIHGLNKEQQSLIEEQFNALDISKQQELKAEIQAISKRATPEQKQTVGQKIKQSFAWLNTNAEHILVEVVASAYYEVVKKMCGL